MSARTVPFVDLGVGEGSLAEAIDAALRRVVASSWYVLGPEVEAFEREIAAHLGVAHAVGTASGTDALSLALLAAGVGPGDEVITSPLTATFTALAISRVGARPVFADVEEATLTLSPESAAARITARTRAIVPVHLYGNACDLDALVALCDDRGLTLVEDACQAHGARLGGRALGSFGRAGALSFYPTKNLGGLGDGGMLLTGDADVAAAVTRLRNGGQSSRYLHEEVGINSRLDEIQAAVLRAKLPYLERWNERRRALAARYERGLEGSPARPIGLREPESSARHLFVVRVRERDAFIERAAADGVACLIHYPVPAHLQPAYRHLGQAAGSCPVAERAASEIVSLPLHPGLSDDDADYVLRTVRAIAED